MSGRLFAHRRLLLIAVIVVVLDQLSKAWIAGRLPYGTYGEEGGAIAVIPGFFYLVHVGNTGAAWSLFSGRSAVLAAVAAVTLAAIFLAAPPGTALSRVQVYFGLLCGGIIGNLVDRLRHGHVIDFIDLHFGRHYAYPTFNLADAGICVGVALYFIQSLRKPA